MNAWKSKRSSILIAVSSFEFVNYLHVRILSIAAMIIQLFLIHCIIS